MFNIIGNSCVSSWITTKFLNQELINPFAWCIIDFNSCFNLVKHWDSINFENYRLKKDDNFNISIIIDNLVKVDYVHYRFHKNYNTPTKIEEDIFYNKIWEFIVDKYIKRLKKMRESNINPVFIFATANHGLARHKPFTLAEQSKLDELNSKYTIILSFDKMIDEPKNVITIKQSKKFQHNGLEFSEFIFHELEKLHIFL